MPIRAAAAVLIVALAAGAAGQAPVAVVERTVTEGELATRVSLFSNGVVVVTIRRDDKQELLRRMTLPDNEYMVYLEVIEKNTRELGVRPVTSSVETSHAEVVLSLHAGLDTPRTIRFSPMSSVKLPLAKILGALDDLQLQTLEASPSEEAMREWRPRKGDRVELFTGKTATVVEVWDDGMVILELDGTYVRESVPVDLRSQIILRVLGTPP